MLHKFHQNQLPSLLQNHGQVSEILIRILTSTKSDIQAESTAVVAAAGPILQDKNVQLN